MSWFAGLNEFVRENVPLAPFTWFRLGGPARWLVTPRNEEELSVALRRCSEAGIDVRFLGKGANVLIDDAGVDGAVVRLEAPFFGRAVLEGDCLAAGAGADLMELVKRTAKAGLSGLEVLAGIPASVGGAIRMNCGGKYGEIGTCVRRVRVISQDGTVRERGAVRFHYRGTDLGEERVLGATFELVRRDPATTYGEYERIWREKMACQPTLGERSAGCIFRNPRGQSAGKLIDSCGLKGRRAGGAEVSSRHANFIVAGPGATSADVVQLIRAIQREVEGRTGVRLELEVERWGEFDAESHAGAHDEEAATRTTAAVA